MGGGPVATYVRPVTTPPLCPWGFYPSGRVHHALDFPVVVGTKFRIAYSGVVKVAGWSTTGFGNHIRVLMDDGNTVIYGHLSKFYVKVGQRVTAGQYGGETGNTGNSTGPHIHMEVRRVSTDPTTSWDFTSRLVSYVAPDATPTPSEEDDMPLSDDDIKRIWGYKNAALTSRDAYDLLRRVGIQVWDDTTVTRDGQAVTVKQDVASQGTTTFALPAEHDATQRQISELGAKFDTLTAAVANLVTLIQESHPKPEPDPEQKPLPWVGVDVSGYQTVDVVKAHAASDDFVIVKATEGQGARLTSFTDRIAAVRGSSAEAGTYHYAWPQNGWEADFANYAGYAQPRVGEVNVLDFEPWASRQPEAKPETFPAYIIGWADANLAKFGRDPLLYMPDYFVSQVKKYATSAQWERIARIPFFKPGKGGVYVSDPAVGYGDTFGFQTLAMWQWTDKPLDQDLLYVPWADIANTKA